MSQQLPVSDSQPDEKGTGEWSNKVNYKFSFFFLGAKKRNEALFHVILSNLRYSDCIPK